MARVRAELGLTADEAGVQVSSDAMQARGECWLRRAARASEEEERGGTHRLAISALARRSWCWSWAWSSRQLLSLRSRWSVLVGGRGAGGFGGREVPSTRWRGGASPRLPLMGGTGLLMQCATVRPSWQQVR